MEAATAEREHRVCTVCGSVMYTGYMSEEWEGYWCDVPCMDSVTRALRNEGIVFWTRFD